MSELSDSCDGSHKYLNTESFPDIVLYSMILKMISNIMN